MTTRKTKYRIVPDNYKGFQIDYKLWWWPFWIQWDRANTFSTLEEAEAVIERLLNVKIYS